MADGVGAGLLDAQHDVVDEIVLGAVQPQVVADALAGARQPRRLEGQAKAQVRQRGLQR